MFIPSKDNIDVLYASLQEYFNIKYDREINKYLGIEQYRCPNVSIHVRQPYLTPNIINKIPGMEKSSADLTPVVKPPIAKHEEAQEGKITLIKAQ